MLNFQLYTPTKVIFGKDTELDAAQEIKSLGCKKVLVHYGGQSARKSGLLDRIENSLKEAGIDYISLGGVVPNPRLSLVYKGIELCKEAGVDFILAVGGGSVIDSAKAIGYGLTNDFDVWDIYEKKAVPTACTPIGVILTIAAAGSETSDSSVITNEEGWLKRGFSSDYCRPKFAIMNPELTYTLPEYQTFSGGTDILMHTQERYFTPTKDVDFTDALCEALLRVVIKHLLILKEDPNNYDSRAQVMWAGSISHNGLMSTGRGTDFASHQMEHELGGLFDCAHGAGLSAVWPSWARYVYKHDVGRFAQYAVNVMGCTMDFQNPEKTALEGIAKMEEFYHKIGMPITIKELGFDVTDEQINEMAEKATWFGQRKIGGFVELDKDDIVAIYKMAR
ncbi:iron-containing alcohol dehydrogenase [Anaerolentibacter hominis]|uniref:iron-containing alcohol dehydrogenase n=1 Tax=Anaerolentibacter hominis TaxID=3079009 RepID=UPI0031B898C5